MSQPPSCSRPAAEPVPALEQPPAAVGGRLDAEEDRQRLAPAGPEGGVAVLGEEREEVLGGLALGLDGVGQQPAAQGGQLLLLVGLRLRRGGPDGRGRPRGLDPLGPFDLPQGEGGLLGQGELEGVARGHGVDDALDVLPEGLRVLAGQDRDASGHAVLDGVHSRTSLPLRGGRASTPCVHFCG